MVKETSDGSNEGLQPTSSRIWWS